MNEALAAHRLQFAFTVTYHYLFPQLTMGLALLLVIWKVQAFRRGGKHYQGVVTGIPMEFQFGTNWAELSRVPRQGCTDFVWASFGGASAWPSSPPTLSSFVGVLSAG